MSLNDDESLSQPQEERNNQIVKKREKKQSKIYDEEKYEEETDEEFQDWWMKYYASLDVESVEDSTDSDLKRSNLSKGRKRTKEEEKLRKLRLKVGRSFSNRVKSALVYYAI